MGWTLEVDPDGWTVRVVEALRRSSNAISYPVCDRCGFGIESALWEFSVGAPGRTTSRATGLSTRRKTKCETKTASTRTAVAAVPAAHIKFRLWSASLISVNSEKQGEQLPTCSCAGSRIGILLV